MQNGFLASQQLEMHEIKCFINICANSWCTGFPESLFNCDCIFKCTIKKCKRRSPIVMNQIKYMFNIILHLSYWEM